MFPVSLADPMSSSCMSPSCQHHMCNCRLIAGTTAASGQPQGSLRAASGQPQNSLRAASGQPAYIHRMCEHFASMHECACRLAADTTTVSDQVCLNMNVGLRSVTQATMVLFFMFAASWRLTVVTFVIIPVILAVTKLYGQYVRYALAGRFCCCSGSCCSIADDW